MKYKIAAGLTLFIVALLCSTIAIADADTDVQAILHEAERATRQLKKGRADQYAMVLMRIAIVHAKRGDRKTAEKTLLRVLKLSTTAKFKAMYDEQDREMFRVQIAKAQAEFGGLTGALKTVDAIGDSARKHFALMEIATTLAENGNIKSASAIYRKIPSKAGFWKSQALSAVIEAQAQAGDFMAAREAVKQFDQLQADNDNDRKLILVRKGFSLHAIAVAQANRCKFLQALETASSIKNIATQIRALCDIAKLQAAKKDKAAAKRTLKKALRIAEKRKKGGFDRIAYLQADFGDLQAATQTTSKHLRGMEAGCAKLRISIGYSRAGKNAKSKQFFEEGIAIIRASKNSEILYVRYVLEDIAVKWVMVGDIARAIAIAKVIGKKGHDEIILRAIVSQILKSGTIDRALAIAELIKHEPYHRTVAFRAIAVAQTKSEKLKAKKSFEKALKAAKAIPIGGGTDVNALYELGRAQSKAGFSDDASKTFALARQKALKYKEASYIAQLFQDIARAQTASGDLKGAILSARSQPTPIRRVRSLIGVAEGIVSGRK